MASRIRIRRGTTAQWLATTKVLSEGEFGLDTTLDKVKIGNGTSLWADLPFLHNTPTELNDAITTANEYTDEAVASLGNSLPESYVLIGDVGQPDGVASLDPDGKIPDSEIPAGIARDSEIPSSTSSISEGTNLYFTDERAQDAVGNAVGNGILYNNTTGALSVDTSVISTKTYADTTATAAATLVFNNILDSAPTALNTLNELAAAINDDQSFASTVTGALSGKLSIETATSDYLKINDAASTYLAQTAATSTYLDKTQPALDYQIFNSGMGGYIVNGVLNGPITLTPGKPARISIQAPGHPLWFQTSYGAYNQADVYETGIEGSGTATGQIVILLPLDAPQLYYACQFHEPMKGVVLFEKDSGLQAFTAKTGSYTPVLMDMGEIIEMSGGGIFTITDSEAFPIGTTFEILQTGTSQVTIAGDGFTPNSTPGLKLRTQWSSATVIKRSLNSWVVLGDLSA
jgi:hypothetical protein